MASFSPVIRRIGTQLFWLPFWLAGVAWRHAHIFRAHPMTQFVYSDMQGYYESALRWYTPGYAPNVGDAVYPPGAGYFFGFFHKFDPTWISLEWALFLLSCATPLCLGWIAWNLFGARVAGLTIIFASLYFPWVDFFAFFLSEALFIPATVCAFALTVLALLTRHRVLGFLPAIAAGLMFGLAASVKTVALSSAVLIGGVLLWWQWRRRVSGLYRTVGYAAIGLVPVLVAVSHRCTKANEGHFCLVSTNGPLTTIFGHLPWVRSITWVDSARGLTLGWGCPVSAQRRMFDQEYTFNFGPYDGKANMAKIVEIVRADPVQALALSFDQIANLFYGSIPWPSSHTKWTRWALESEQGFLFLGMIPALFQLRRRARGLFRLDPAAAPEILLSLPVVGLTLTCFLTQGDPRYRIPLDGFIMILASAEIAGWFGGRQQACRLPEFGQPRRGVPRALPDVTTAGP